MSLTFSYEINSFVVLKMYKNQNKLEAILMVDFANNCMKNQP